MCPARPVTEVGAPSAVDGSRTPSGFRQEASTTPPHARENTPRADAHWTRHSRRGHEGKCLQQRGTCSDAARRSPASLPATCARLLRQSGGWGGHPLMCCIASTICRPATCGHTPTGSARLPDGSGSGSAPGAPTTVHHRRPPASSGPPNTGGCRQTRLAGRPSWPPCVPCGRSSRLRAACRRGSPSSASPLPRRRPGHRPACPSTGLHSRRRPADRRMTPTGAEYGGPSLPRSAGVATRRRGRGPLLPHGPLPLVGLSPPLPPLGPMGMFDLIPVMDLSPLFTPIGRSALMDPPEVIDRMGPLPVLGLTGASEVLLLFCLLPAWGPLSPLGPSVLLGHITPSPREGA